MNAAGSRLLRRIGVVATLGALTLSLVMPTSSAQSTTSAVEGMGLQTLGACLSRTPHLIVALVVDESGSLVGTDPNALRVPAIRAALGSLLSLTRKSGNGEPIQVDVQINGFSSEFVNRGPWTPLTAESVDPLLAEADAFGPRNTGQETDYVLALEGANDALASRASELAAGGTPTCKALVWFTDGNYDIDNAAFGSKPYAPGAGGTQAKDLGEQRLCSPQGVADQLRGNGVVNVAVGLNADSDPTLLDLMRSIAIGGDCGGFEAPENMGVLLGVSDVNLLTAAMLEAVSGTPGRPAGEAQICGALPCQRTITIDIPAGVGSFYLLTTASGDGIERWIKAPDTPGAELVETGAGSSTLGSSAIDPLKLSASTVMIDVDLDDQSPATGTWEVSFVDPTGADIGALATADVYLFGALSPRFVDDPVFRSGESSSVEISVVDVNGEPASGTLAASTTLAVSIGDPVSGEVRRVPVTGPDGDGRYRFDYVADRASTAAALNVTASLSVVLDDGLALRPIVVERAIAIEVPVVVPSLVTNELRLNGIEGAQPAQGTIEVAGPERGEGEVCVRSWDSRNLPEGVANASLVDEKSCVTVAAGATATLDFSVLPDGSGSGTASGLVEVELVSADGSERVLRSIPTSFEMQRAVDQGRRWLVFVLMMLVGLGVPIAGFVLISRALTKLPASGTVMWAEVPAEIQRGVMTRRRDPEGAVTFTHSDWNYLASSNPRQAPVGSSTSVVVNHRPFGISDLMVRSAGDSIGSGGSRRRGGVNQAVVPLQLTRSWAFVVDEVALPDTTGIDQDDRDASRDAIVRGRLIAFMDDRYEWLERSKDLASEAASLVPSHIEPLIKAHVDQQVNSAPSGAVLAGATVGGEVASNQDPFASTSETSLPGWDDSPSGGGDDWSPF